MKYEIVKGIIKKTDFTSEYEPKAFNEALIATEKKLKEAVAQKSIYDAKADNVARNHPHVLKVDEEKKNAIWMYHENAVASKQLDPAIKDIKRNLKGLKKEMKDIEAQTGHKF